MSSECSRMSLLFIPAQIWPTKVEDWEFQPNSVQLKIFCKPPHMEKQTYMDVQSAKPQNWWGAFSLTASKAPALMTRSTTLPPATVHSSTQQIYLSHPISSHPPVSKCLCSLLAPCFSQWPPLPQTFPGFETCMVVSAPVFCSSLFTTMLFLFPDLKFPD